MISRSKLRIAHLIAAVAIAVVVLAVGRPIRAAQFPPFDPTETDRQIDRLAQGDWRVRRQAVRALVLVGPPVEAPLKDRLVGNTSPEFRLRAEEVLRRVDPMRRTETALITLVLKDASAKSAFDQLARIEGASLRTEPADLLDHVADRITAILEHRPYWEVVLEFCRQTDIHLRCNEAGVTLVRPKKPGPPRKFAVSGMFLVTPTWITGFKEVGPGMRISVYAEPRARVLRGDSPFTLTQATDAAGRSLLSESSLNTGGSSATNGYSWSAGLSPLAHPDTVLAGCRGIARVIVAETYQTLEAPGFASAKSLTDAMPVRLSAGSMSASIVRVVNTGGEYQMDVQLSTDPAEVDWESLMFSVRSGGMSAFDVNGAELTLIAAQCDGGGPTNNLRCRWGNRAEHSARETAQPYRLVWQVPARSVHLAVPFELNDVMLR